MNLKRGLVADIAQNMLEVVHGKVGSYMHRDFFSLMGLRLSLVSFFSSSSWFTWTCREDV